MGWWRSRGDLRIQRRLAIVLQARCLVQMPFSLCLVQVPFSGVFFQVPFSGAFFRCLVFLVFFVGVFLFRVSRPQYMFLVLDRFASSPSSFFPPLDD
jgi:hypothetical protein